MMKKVMTLIAALAAGSLAVAQSASVVVEKVDNHKSVEGNTYRVYVKAPSVDHTIHAVFADKTSDISIESTAPFYQNEFGSHLSSGINAAIVELQPALAYDSYIALGSIADPGNNVWEAGVNAENFENGESLFVEDGSWFLLPTSSLTHVNDQKMILVAQLTTTGEVRGTINVQGWDVDKNVWQARGLEFSSKDATTLTNEEASAPAVSIAVADDATDFQVFPNPVTNGQINIQFNGLVEVEKGNLAVDIIDMNGKVVIAQEIASESILGGNRVIIDQDLAAGVYSVSIRQGNTLNATQQVVVAK